jgi:hypothetical protein
MPINRLQQISFRAIAYFSRTSSADLRGHRGILGTVIVSGCSLAGTTGVTPMLERRSFLKAFAGFAAFAATAATAVAAPLLANNPAEKLPRPEERQPALDTREEGDAPRVEKVQWRRRRWRVRRWRPRRWGWRRRRVYWRPRRRRFWRRRRYYW